MEIMLLNLDRSQDRLDYFRSVNRHLTRVRRVSAVDGRTLDRDALIRNGVIGVDLPYTAGAIGCALSHGKLWKQALTENRPLTIAEDDAVFSYFFEEKSRSLLRDVEDDWDFILWGYSLRQYLWVGTIPGSIVSEIRFADSAESLRLDSFQYTRSPTLLLKMINSFTYICYSISPRGAKKLLNGCFPLVKSYIQLQFGQMEQPNNGIDCVANRFYPTMNAYVCVAPLAISEDKLASTIS